jgi:hypothetical protein
VRNTRGPRFGINVINTEHRPFRTPFIFVPAKTQLREPDTMVNRILPCDVLGMVIETWRARVRAVRYFPRLTVSVECVDVLDCCCEVGANVVDVDVVDEVVDDVVELVDEVVDVVVVANTFKVPTVTAEV